MGAAAAVMVRLSGADDGHGNTFDLITKLVDTPSATVWRIDQPNVKGACFNHPEIQFAAGDILNVAVGGAVQTGGIGKTWKLYLNPSGPNSDHLYHGLIEIPGLVDKLTRFQDFGINRNFVIKAPTFLMLGYEDDGYGDNGYYAHDDGTQDQARHIGPAWVVVSVGHNGTQPYPASQFGFVGVSPGNFRSEAAWAFRNFDTADLSLDTFTSAFDLQWYDYINPVTWILFGACRGIGSGGNCFGMSLMAAVGEDQFVIGQFQEHFWDNYKVRSDTTPVTAAINTFHWKQISGHYLKGWLSGDILSASVTAAAIERDLTKADYNYGLLSIAHGTDGHVLVPLSVKHMGQQTLIYVYDCNRPSPTNPDPAVYPAVIIDGDNWSYDMGSLGTWSGPAGQTGTGMAYVPYLNSSGWSGLVGDAEGLTEFIFGAGVNVDQVTDSTGHRLYVPGKPGVLDTSAQGLGHGIVRLPRFAQGTVQKRPRSSSALMTASNMLLMNRSMAAQMQKVQTEYVNAYVSGQVYLAGASRVKELTFTLSTAEAGRAVRALISQKGQFIEINAIAQAAANAGAVEQARATEAVEEKAGVRPGFVARSRSPSEASPVVAGNEMKNTEMVAHVKEPAAGEVKVGRFAVAATESNPVLVVHDLANFSAGVSIKDLRGTPLRVNFTHGLVSTPAKTVTIQRADEIIVSSVPIDARLNSSRELQVSAAGSNVLARINGEIVGEDGVSRIMPPQH